jgi:hypothetical protein
VGTRASIPVEAIANARWSVDFVHDHFACGGRFRILNVVDDVTWECLAAIPETSISGLRMTGALGAGLSDASGLRRQPPRNTRSARTRPTPPITCCSHRT